ncbi:cytochrome c oxidase assembly protein Rcf2 [Schizosaccharomyces osmophilus]|uniref:Cytochrome c oxidase assembly protein Rcf2 n=1 Tax=Schizosaccharomyces osmophilus TaxID=2545709 RepID=A0AAE9WB58_9SCHI|nr:cytochrome c oxidase assembly protein Rcf2 [Schizosaccharomyces osmophilus]WBW73031.1 cytochrome c oxidase assembly protein Rcf2 [Schizosaccharomyces osmophilus]
MSLADQQETHAFNQSIYSALFRGGLVGSALGTLGCIVGSRYSPGFRRLSFPRKSWLVIGAGSAVSVIYADKATLKFDTNRFSKIKEVDDSTKHLPWKYRALYYYNEHKWPIILGTWASTLGLSMYAASRNRYDTLPQKLVQARMYAQGVTVLVLLGSVYLTAVASRLEPPAQAKLVTDPTDPSKLMSVETSSKERYPGEYQWQVLVAKEEERLRHLNLPLRTGQSSSSSSNDSDSSDKLSQ